MLEFHFLWDRCRFAKPLRIQTKDKNNGLSDYSHTDLHYLKSFSQLGCLQRGHPSPTKIQSWRVNAGAWAGSVRQMDRWRVDGRANATAAHSTAHRPLHEQSTKLVYMWITYVVCVEKGNWGPLNRLCWPHPGDGEQRLLVLRDSAQHIGHVSHLWERLKDGGGGCVSARIQSQTNQVGDSKSSRRSCVVIRDK